MHIESVLWKLSSMYYGNLFCILRTEVALFWENKPTYYATRLFLHDEQTETQVFSKAVRIFIGASGRKSGNIEAKNCLYYAIMQYKGKISVNNAPDEIVSILTESLNWRWSGGCQLGRNSRCGFTSVRLSGENRFAPCWQLTGCISFLWKPAPNWHSKHYYGNWEFHFWIVWIFGGSFDTKYG